MLERSHGRALLRGRSALYKPGSSIGRGSPPPFSPEQLPGLIRAWRPDASGITTDANGITGVPAAFGTTVALASSGANCPDVGTGLATDDTNLFEHTASRTERFTFTTTGSIGSFTAAFSLAPKATGTSYGIFGLAADATTYLRTQNVMAAMQLRGGGLDTNHNLSFGGGALLTKSLHVIVVTYNAVTGDACAWLDGVKGTVTAVGASLSFEFDRLGVNGAGAAALNGYLGGVLLYNVAHTDVAVAKISRFLARKWKARAIYAASTGSDSSVTPWKSATPLQTFSTAMTHAAPGVIISPKGGEVFRETARVTTALAGPSNTERLIVDGSMWGTGNAQVRFSTAPNVTNTSGTIFSLAGTFTEPQLPAGLTPGTDYGYIDYVPGGVITFSNNYTTTNVVRLTYQAATPTTPASGKWSWDSGTGKIYVNAGVALSNGEIEVMNDDYSAANTFNGLRIAHSNWSVRNLSVQFGAREGIQFQGSANALLMNCEAIFGGADGIGGVDNVVLTRNISIYGTVSAWNGRGAASTGISYGDGYSFHDTSVVAFIQCLSIMNDKSGFNHVHDTTTTHQQCLAIGTMPYRHADTLSNDVGSMSLENCIGVVTAGATYPHAVSTGATFNPSMTVKHCTLVSEDGTGSGILQGTATAPITVQNTIITGFDKGISGVSGTVTITANHNCLFDNGTDYSNVSAGAGDVANDPLFTDLAGRDYTLQAASPCINAAIDLDVINDYAGTSRPQGAANDIGAYERAA